MVRVYVRVCVCLCVHVPTEQDAVVLNTGPGVSFISQIQDRSPSAGLPQDVLFSGPHRPPQTITDLHRLTRTSTGPPDHQRSAAFGEQSCTRKTTETQTRVWFNNVNYLQEILQRLKLPVNVYQ